MNERRFSQQASVRALMRPANVSVRDGSTLASVDRALSASGSRSAVVVGDNGEQLGFVNLHELARAANRLSSDTPVSEIMRPLSASVTFDAVISQAAEAMSREFADAIAVVDDRGLVVGFISSDDMERRTHPSVPTAGATS